MGGVATTAEGYNDILEAMHTSLTSMGSTKGKTRGIRVGQVTKSHQRKPFNAAVVLTVDNKEYSEFLGRDMDYLAIPSAGAYVFNHVRPVMLDIIQNSFETQTEPSGKPWPPITDLTKLWRKYHKPEYDPEGPILQASGELEAAVMNWDRSRGSRTIVGKNARMVISLDELPESEQQKAFVHNIGGPWGWNDSEIPARPFMPSDTGDLSSGDRSAIRKAVGAGFNEYCGTTLNPTKAKKNAAKSRRK